MKIYIITTTFDSLEASQNFAKKVIEQKLAACCQLGKIDSIYQWKNQIVQENEFKATFKTLKKQELVNFIITNHSYEIPEIIIQEVETTKEYFEFVSKS